MRNKILGGDTACDSVYRVFPDSISRSVSFFTGVMCQDMTVVILTQFLLHEGRGKHNCECNKCMIVKAYDRCKFKLWSLTDNQMPSSSYITMPGYEAQQYFLQCLLLMPQIH